MKKNFVMYFLRIFGFLCVVYGLVLLIAGKNSDMFPVWLLLGIFCAGLSLKRVFAWVRSKRWLKALLLTAVALVVVCEGIVVAVGFGSAPATPCDYIIVLGAKVDGELPSKTLQYRLDAAYAYLTGHADTKAVLSGGRGRNEGVSEAESMYMYLTAKGIDKARLILEDKSSNTYENLQNSFSLLGDNGELRISVVTSNYHVLRARLIAVKLGYKVAGIGAKPEWTLAPNSYLRELLGIVKDMLLK